jgi:transposase
MSGARTSPRALEPAVAQSPATGVAAVRTDEPGGPAQPLEVVQTVRVGPEPCLQLADRARVVHARARMIHKPRLLRLDGYPQFPLCRARHNGKKINGRKRHLAVDVEGFVLAVVVTAANVGDRMGAKLLLIRLLDICTRLKLVWADSGYDGAPLATWARNVAAVTLQVIKRTEAHTFKVVPRRWVVERTFGRLLRYRRLVRDYERRPEHHEAMVYWAAIFTMTRRLARQQPGQPPVRQRWGQPRPHPAAAA